jgi:hypothetical protein
MSEKRSILAPWAVFLGLIALAVAGRLLPHAPNFTPVAAAALFAGAYFRRPLVAILVPLVAMLASDLLWLGTHDWRVMAAVYVSFSLPALLGNLTRGKRRWLRVIVCSLASSGCFFLTTNFAVWASGSMYEASWQGLARCYVLALPFLKYTIGGDLAWSVGLFGTLALVTHVQALWGRSRLEQGSVAPGLA